MELVERLQHMEIAVAQELPLLVESAEVQEVHVLREPPRQREEMAEMEFLILLQVLLLFRRGGGGGGPNGTGGTGGGGAAGTSGAGSAGTAGTNGLGAGGVHTDQPLSFRRRWKRSCNNQFFNQLKSINFSG